MTEKTLICWQEAGVDHSARWRSESGSPPPRRVAIADDRMTADAAYRLACEGTALLWRGDFQNGRQLLAAMARRADEKPRKAKAPPASLLDAFHLHRQARSQRARTLGMLLVPFNSDHSISLRRAPDAREACIEAYGVAAEPYIASMRELLGLISAHEWRKNGVEIPILGSRIHPHYGVFAPTRGEYVSLVAEIPLPELTRTLSVAFDIGTGTGVLAAVLARRGIAHIIATDQDPRALVCARENLARLGLTGMEKTSPENEFFHARSLTPTLSREEREQTNRYASFMSAAQVEVVQADLFPEGRAALIVCNPPWVPARPGSPLEYAVFDPESRMLKGFLGGLAAHLETGGEGWLILSDLAEHLGLRTRAELLALIETAGLQVLGKSDVKPHHPRVSDANDPLHAARKAELTSLWRLAVK